MLEELNKIGEQPETLDIHAVETGNEIGSTEGEGSPLGKFKSPEMLLDAYNELQSEFTRKCQKLSEAEKKLQDFSQQNTGESGEKEIEFAWQNKVNEFLQSHKNAKSLAEDITKEIMEDKSFYGYNLKKYDKTAVNQDFPRLTAV